MERLARSAMRRWKSDREDEFFYLKLLLALIVLVLVVAGLIEWNARRQAAAMVRALTPSEADVARLESELAALERATASQLERQRQRATAKTPYYDPRPLDPAERCINHQRFYRLENGWKQVGTCP